MTYADLLAIATEAIDRANKIVARGTVGKIYEKSDRDIASDLDIAIEETLKDFLQSESPEIGFVGEELGGTPGEQPYWTLDPIDGTSNLVRGHPLVAISLALVEERHPVLGIIDAPFLETRSVGVRGQGSTQDGAPIRCRNVNDLTAGTIALGDYATGPDAAERNAPRLRATASLAAKAERVRMHGSAALDLAFVASGRVDGALIFGGYVWDLAAGIIIYREAGAEVTDGHGGLNLEKPHVTVACNSGLLPARRDVVASA